MNNAETLRGKAQVGWLWLALAAMAVLVPAASATAQSDVRAARLSDVDGQVQLSLNNQILAAEAPANTPLFEGTRVATAEDGRAEIQFDDGSVARLSPNSSLTVNVLRQQGGTPQTELLLEGGLVYFELQGMPSSGSFAVHFGNNTVSVSGFTVFRLDLDNPPGALAVFSGNAHLENPAALSLDLHGGESARLNPNDPTSYVLSESIEPDSWDAWNADRDQQLSTEEAQRTQATTNVPNPANPAWSDLDANGNWYNVPGQGYIWSPYAAGVSGWDPYGCGYWVMTQYGYVWASCEPWGYLPYAGGSWAFYNGIGWGWSPGSDGWWWNTGVWVPTVATNSFNYIAPRRPRGGPIAPGRGNPGHTASVIAVNRFHSDGQTGPVRPRSGAVTIAGATVLPMRPIAVSTVRTHEPSVGSVYTPAPIARSGNAPAPGSGFIRSTSGNNIGLRPSYLPNNGQNNARALPGMNMTVGGRAFYSGGQAGSVSHAAIGGSHAASSSSASSGGGAVHSSGGASFGGGGGGASHSVSSGGSGGGGGSSHH